EIAEVLALLERRSNDAATPTWPGSTEAAAQEAHSTGRGRAHIVIPLAKTSMGIQISCGKSTSPKGGVFHYSLSGASGAIQEDAVRLLENFIAKLPPSSASYKIIKGNANVFPLLFRLGSSDFPAVDEKNRPSGFFRTGSNTKAKADGERSYA